MSVTVRSGAESAPPTALLRELWRQRARLLASNVATNSREHREIAHAAALIGQDYHDRFLIELIQNANDQALLGGAQGSTVLIVRSEQFLAVSNGGQVLTAVNLARISSLADSDKTGVLVGNKGVGFKAVYQVTDAPEVYSAAETPASPDRRDVLSHFGVGIALERDPFRNAHLSAAVEEDVRTFFRENQGLDRALAEQGVHDPVAAVKAEFKRVAGFKFPVPRSLPDLQARMQALAIPPEYRDDIRTLVVLPLREGAGVLAEHALDHLVGVNRSAQAQAELAVLFLEGVGRIVVADHVRDRTWNYVRSCRTTTDGVQDADVTMASPGGTVRTNHYWLVRGDVYSCDEADAIQRRRIVAEALVGFGLEPWKPDDPLPVTVALPKPVGDSAAPLGPEGRFCLGLPTEQSTGLPAHVDARFFATISRTGLDFSHPYNDLLLRVATGLFGSLLGHLRRSSGLAQRRAATLALQRRPGALAERVYAQGGVADEKVILRWDGDGYARRQDCTLPTAQERALLPLIEDALSDDPATLARLPESGLLTSAADVLQSIGLAEFKGTPHPWLARREAGLSAVEQAAKLHRGRGPQWWEAFIGAVLDCFPPNALESQAWLPVGKWDLASPTDRVFLPAPMGAQEDDDEVADVPPRIAGMLRLVDASAVRLREGGRALTPLARRLAEARAVRQPRKTELLEDALFPALESAARTDHDLALDLFGQALAWIATMRDVSRRKLDCRQARVPVATSIGIAWEEGSRCYLGEEWSLSQEDDHLLGMAYPDRRLLPFRQVASRFGVSAAEASRWRTAVEALGVAAVPRIISPPRGQARPLQSSQNKLVVKGTPSLGRPDLDPIYRQYVEFLTRFPTRWYLAFDHDVEDVKWIEGLENVERRQHVLDLVLAHPDAFLPHADVPLRRVGDGQSTDVPQCWAFAATQLGWPIFPAERGVGGQRLRVPTSQLWRLPDGGRRSGYARLINVVPHALARAVPLLGALGVPSIEDARLERLFAALSDLAQRLAPEGLSTRREALSLANELFAAADDRLEHHDPGLAAVDLVLPLLRDRQLHAVRTADDAECVIVFDDDPARARHVMNIDRGFRVPVPRDSPIDRLHALFTRWYGAHRIVRSSTAPVALAFTAAPGQSEGFLEWLQRVFPQLEVAVELAALLTHGGDRALLAEPISRQWPAFERLKVEFGTFGSNEVKSFYDRPTDVLKAASSLSREDVVAATWEVAGVRSRDAWDRYAQALRNGTTREFLRERAITDVEITNVADAAGLFASHGIEVLDAALVAVRCHLAPGTTVEDAAEWWAKVEHIKEVVVRELGHPGFEPLLAEAMAMGTPDGDLYLLGQLGVPLAFWQAAVVRRDGRPHVFGATVGRYQLVREHLVAVVREISVRDDRTDLRAIGAAIAPLLNAAAPEETATLPPDLAQPDRAAWDAVRAAVAHLPALFAALDSLPAPPWVDDLPIPADATRRGVRLFLQESQGKREIEASTSVQAVVRVASRLAAMLSELIDSASVLADADLRLRFSGEWAHVYAALARLRARLESDAPKTVKRLSEVQAFRDPCTEFSLLIRLPEIKPTDPPPPQPKETALGMEFTATELRADLSSGSRGQLGTKLAAAAAQPLDPAILAGVRTPLPPLSPLSKGRSGGGGGGGATGRPRREAELIGDLGEALVHEWLAAVLGSDYGPECWVSKARDRYGLPPCGEDGLGYDFAVADPEGRLFRRPAPTIWIEVKSTSTDGRDPFPMSRAEWDQARICHEGDGERIYVIVRVVNADQNPRIGDVVIDPFAAHRRGEIQLSDRDLWVTVAPLQLPDEET